MSSTMPVMSVIPLQGVAHTHCGQPDLTQASLRPNVELSPHHSVQSVASFADGVINASALVEGVINADQNRPVAAPSGPC